MSFDKQLGTSTGALGAPQLSVCVWLPRKYNPGLRTFHLFSPLLLPFLATHTI